MNPIRKIRTDGGDVSIFRTIGFIGDSLSSGEHESLNEKNEKGYWDYYEYSWGQYIARTCHLKGYNFSRGGLTAKHFFTDYIVNVNSPFEEEKKCQAYVIALDVNDMHHLAEYYQDGLGNPETLDYQDDTKNDDSFYAWYIKIIIKLRELEPKCRIFVVSNPLDYRDTKDIAELYDKIQKFLYLLTTKYEFLYVVDLRKYAPKYTKKFFKKYWCGGHMSALGYKFTGDMIATYMSYYINKYPEDFTQVAFIGKDVHNIKEKW